ncbi:hypothetical protein [Streptococcus chenjunshii]|uniref:hypothetical protein n=1 Tax=Streptococcus chenjunshii TaxID=2173853 RepID=UPI001F5408F2|nr:hypothetical protein [Streptococcus chenjunshii]
MFILSKLFNISLNVLFMLEKLEQAFEKCLFPLSLLFLGISYLLAKSNRQLALVFGMISAIMILFYLILGAYLFLRIKFLLWKKHQK